MKRKALFVGVNNYQDPQIRNLSCSVRDAISMHDIFEELGYETDLLENPGKGDVFQAVKKMTDDMTAGDQFLFYFAGHGFTDSGQHLLFCADDVYAHLRFHRAGIPFDLIELETRKGGFGRAFLLDACQSDFLTGTRGEDTTTRDLVAIGDMVPKEEDAPGAFYVLRQSRSEGVELALGEALCDAVTGKMRCIATKEGMAVVQTPEFAKSGLAQILLEGGRRKTSAQWASASQIVLCPVCGRHNPATDTFKCSVCGTDHLCMAHLSDMVGVCASCAKKEKEARAQRLLEQGGDYRHGRNGVEKDLEKAHACYRAAAELGNPVAQNTLGMMYVEGDGVAKDCAEAEKWFRMAAEQGNVDAQANLGGMYLSGCGVKEDYAEAMKWLRKAAEQGNDVAQKSLGWMYRAGHGVLQDDAEAVKWFRKAAEQGNASAQKLLGDMYHKGRGVVQDDVEAMKWYRESAEQGYVWAQMNVAFMCMQDGAVAKDYEDGSARRRKMEMNAWRRTTSVGCTRTGMAFRGTFSRR